MIAFGSVVSHAEANRRFAQPGIELAAEPDAAVHVLSAVGSICRGYNLLLDTVAAAHGDELEALVIADARTEIADRELCAKVRAALRDPDVAVAGAVGARGLRTLAWWEGEVSAAPVVHRYYEHGGGELEGYGWARPTLPLGEVDAVDGFLLVLSPWAVRTIRFDETLATGHGFDVDYCLQVREAGRKVVTADLRTIHHRTLELVSDREAWVEEHIRFADKWDGRWPGREPEPDWQRRARRAEAEREAARTFAYSSANRLDAEVRALERETAALTESPSWRLTAPLRWVNRVRRRRARA
jgi:hypothetical protein